MRKSVLALAALVALPPSAQARRRDEAAAGRRTDAERALRTGHYEEARRTAAEAARRAPADTRAVVVAARAEEALGLYPEARRRLEEAAAAAPDDLPLRDALMRLYAGLGDRAALAPLVDRSYADWSGGRVDKSRAADLIAVATAVRLDNNWKDASDTLRDAVHADPRAADANLDWGWTFIEKHAAAEAEVSFREVLKLDPDNPDAHVGMARVALDQR
jgi:Tfp pilus assembly protein PilF